MKECPRCLLETLHEEEVRNALSRMDNETYICSSCGLHEAFHLKRENRVNGYWVMFFPVFHAEGYGIFKGAELVGARRTIEEAFAFANALEPVDIQKGVTTEIH